MAEPKKDADANISNKHKPDISITMIGGSLYRNLGGPSYDANGSPLIDHAGNTLPSLDVTAQIVYTTQNSFKTKFLDKHHGKSPDHWKSQSGMSLDGLFIPYSAAFAKRNAQGELVTSEGFEIDGTKAMPHFEKPYSFVDEKGNEILLSDWGHVGSGTVNSSTLYPYPSGHNVSYMVRGASTQDIKGELKFTQGGEGTAYPKLGGMSTEHENLGGAARPVGLRGPAVLTGWGYDTHGMPVPYAKYDAVLRVGDRESDFWGSPRNEPANYANKNPQKHFLPHHLQRTDQWKSGPIDLRWDRDRKVWVGGRHNGIYLCKTTKCILPRAGIDGSNSFNFGIENNIASLGRLYRNPCPSDECDYFMYFPKSSLYPDIEIYDPEDENWCGQCLAKKDSNDNLYANCNEFVKACVPFYDAVILRSTDHVVDGKNSRVNCGDKFYKAAGGNPYARRLGDPCHGWGSTKDYETKGEKLVDKVLGKDDGTTKTEATFSETALPLLYQKIIIENPLNQGLMLGDNFLSYDTGRRIVVEYSRSKSDTVCKATGLDETITVKEVIPIHIILQAEFFGMEIISHAGCEQGEMSSCTRKFFAQGFVTGEDCGPDDDYPLTAIRQEKTWELGTILTPPLED